MLNEKLNCIESLVRAVDRTKAWRKTMAANFSRDERNILAAEILEQLAGEASAMTDAQWQALQPCCKNPQVWREALFNSTRQVGFAHKARDFDAFVKLVVRQAMPVRVAA